MKRVPFAGLGLFALFLLLATAPRAFAASFGVRDDAHFFSQDAISRADSVIKQIEQKHHKDVLIETLPGIPQDQQAALQQEGKTAFFEKWADQRAHDNAVDGVYVLITRNPGHVQAWDGNKTSQRLFTDSERNHLAQQILIPAFRDKQFDQGLTDGVQYIQQRMDAQAPTGARANSTGGAAAVPPRTNSPNYPQSNFPQSSHGFGIGGWICLGVGILVIFMLIRAVMGRRNYGPPGGGGGYYPPGGGAGYPPAGGYGPGYGAGYGGGGGGFGRGLLGGLLGGALGGYVGEKWAERGQQGGGYVNPPQGGDYSGGGGDYSSGVDTSGTSSGGDFDSGAGGGGADFSGGGGGGDFGGGGGDVGGGGDFGGGGGDSGSSGGGDF